MLSRSSSNATDRLRRAKSNSSTHTTASGHQRLPTVTEPHILRRQAETAAIEAYARAQQQVEASEGLMSRPRPDRRRSQNTGRSEGSHFADARRRSIQSEAAKPPSQSRHSSPVRAQSTADVESVITRRRSVIVPVAHAVDASESPSAPPLRKRASGYTDGSPAPRYSQLPEKRSSVLQLRPSEEEHADGYTENLAQLSDFTQNGPQHSVNVPGQGPGISDFQLAPPKRVRARKSFLGSFQKRTGGFDMALPPFNHAGSKTAVPNAGPSMGTVPGIKIEEQKTRKFSDTIKGRLKKVFRRTSKMSMPVQHVHAKDFHFSVRDHDVSEASFVDYTDPFMTMAAEEPRPAQEKYATAQSVASTARDSNPRSRVTSWANSSLAVSSVRTANGPFAVSGAHHDHDLVPPERHDGGASPQFGEPPVLKRSGSKTTLRQASSFFGRPIRNKLRRSSRTDLKGSGESQGLYSALQSRIRSARSTETENEIHISAPLETMVSQMAEKSSGLATLPSQRQYSTSSGLSSSTSSQNRNRLAVAGMRNGDHPTIRPVTPELAPVLESASPEADQTVIHHEVESPAASTPGSALRRSHAVKAPPPSKEQLLKRKEKAESRWTTALASGGFDPYTGDNPYELPSLSGNNHAVTPQNGLPHATRAKVISPSLYSRATDGASPRPDTPDDIGMTTITITGREVRKYDISPPKHAHRHQSSHEWRKWLSTEINSFENHEEPVRPTSSASMNGRYPIIDRSRNSSQLSVPIRPESGGMHSMARSRKASVESAMHSHTATAAGRHRTISNPRSIAEIEAASRAEIVPKTNRHLAVTVPPETKSTKRPKSAFELRVNYKNNAADRAKPLEVRRKTAESNMIEDHTIINISAGPYANQENQRPVAELEGSGIPALSSSEWLGSKKKTVRKASGMKRSPGQRMVTSWLDGKSKENVGAFV